MIYAFKDEESGQHGDAGWAEIQQAVQEGVLTANTEIYIEGRWVTYAEVNGPSENPPRPTVVEDGHQPFSPPQYEYNQPQMPMVGQHHVSGTVRQKTVEKSDGGHAALIFGIIFAVLCLSVGGWFVGTRAATNRAQAARVAAARYLRVESWKWDRNRYGDLVADFKVVNDGPFPVKDPRLACEVLTASGTRIETLDAWISGVIEAGESRQFGRVSFGLIDREGTEAKAKVIEAIQLK